MGRPSRRPALSQFPTLPDARPARVEPFSYLRAIRKAIFSFRWPRNRLAFVPNVIRVQDGVLFALQAHAQGAPDHERCGLLAGREGVISRVLHAHNVAGDPATQYEIAPQELFQMMREIRSAGLQLLGIYHSHPHGANQPSRTDVQRAYYPDAAYFIISPQPNEEKPVRAFAIRDGFVSELNISSV
jgi:proteasome lid subunit RPN8/RPN11